MRSSIPFHLGMEFKKTLVTLSSIATLTSQSCEFLYTLINITTLSLNSNLLDNTFDSLYCSFTKSPIISLYTLVKNIISITFRCYRINLVRNRLSISFWKYYNQAKRWFMLSVPNLKVACFCFCIMIINRIYQQ